MEIGIHLRIGSVAGRDILYTMTRESVLPGAIALLFTLAIVASVGGLFMVTAPYHPISEKRETITYLSPQCEPITIWDSARQNEMCLTRVTVPERQVALNGEY
ncbi:MAG: hypothetical protein JO056_09620 [Alphaproteobacteria bacterium]|nr:hypothetical protein [Alphaproteobacteria bacterium]